MNQCSTTPSANSVDTSVRPTMSNGVAATSTIRWIMMTRTAVASVTETGKKALTGLRVKNVFRNPDRVRHQLVVGDGNAKEQVDLGALPHHPERREGPETDLIWLFQVSATTAAPHASSANS